MKTLLIFLLSLSFIQVIGQKTKLIKNKDSYEEYYVLTSNKSIRQGKYIRHGNHNSIAIQGYYRNGVKDSIWDFYGFDGLLEQKYDFTKNELIYYRIKDKDKDKKYRVIEGSDTTEKALDRPTLYIGGDQALTQYISDSLEYPAEARDAGIMGTVDIGFVIDKAGKTFHYRIVDGPGHGLNEEALKWIKRLPNNWMPGVLNGQKVDVDFIMPVHFELR